MKLVIVSDTHCQQFPIEEEGDVLIHCGDHTFYGKGHESYEAINWFANVGKFKHRIYIAGNHEVGWEEDKDMLPAIQAVFPSLIYLQDSAVEIDGIKFWGSPYQPEFFSWAFQKSRSELAKHWEAIPDDVDVLITHGPPYGFGDVNLRDERFGDTDLLARVLKVKPQLHCYGHAHHGYGQWFHEGIQFINAAVLNEGYMKERDPVVVEIDARKH